ncbi:hypothetical protein [Psychroserpens algicola]|uniref:Fibronectin type-III domain-containing protein n=1 Tax=Psychroserpens algicola TaxID=1719034 RepID=A0ABT0HEH0_9FLAO|nr:hypothetical protein [Psychroserpens algicola]MCK8482227.1 hypothetical protein [Psychroserpens algicola]
MKKINSILLATLSLLIVSCDDIIEEDLTNDNIQTISPNEGAVIEGNTVQFVWQALDGADDYRLQILNTNQSLVVDTLVTTTNFNAVLNPGDYQWRVKGENFAYTTQYTFPINFTMTASDDLTNQNVQLSTPSDNFYTNDTSIILTWSSIASAESYSLDVIKLNGGEETVLQEMDINAVNYTLPASIFDEDAEFVWKVKAVNSTSESSFSERSIFIDRQTPNQPSLVTPLEAEETTALTVTFNWLTGADTGNIQSVTTNTFEISSDSNFGSLLFTEDLQNNSIPITFEDSGTYYWRVRTFDAAGNVGDYSITRSVVIL